jgi:hypothetical protein
MNNDNKGVDNMYHIFFERYRITDQPLALATIIKNWGEVAYLESKGFKIVMAL